MDETAQQALTWFNGLVVGISPRRSWTEPWSVQVQFMVGEWHWERFLTQYFRHVIHVVDQHCTYSPSTTDSGVPKNFVRGCSTNSVEDRGQRERGSGGGSP